MKSRGLLLVIAGVLSFLAVTIPADTVSAAPAITSPKPESTLPSTTAVFTGEQSQFGDVRHWLFVGTTQGSSNLLSQDLGTEHTATVSGLPTSGTIWVRYWTLSYSNGWLFTDQSYTMITPVTISPVPGSTLPSTTAVFTGGHTASDMQHWLYVGTAQGGFDLFNQDLGTGHTATVSGLPTSGTIWVRYWTWFNTGWAFTDQSYMMSVGPPAIASPLPGSALMNKVTFTGAHASGDLQHWLYVGTTQGISNLFNQDLGTGHTAMVSGLPDSGTIWVRYWTRLGGGWVFTDQTYAMKAPPAVTSPVPGSTLLSTTVTIMGEHDSADLQHWLYVGTAQGGYDLFSQDLGTGHTATVSANGTIWVRYWTRFSTGWFFTDQSYTIVTEGIVSPLSHAYSQVPGAGRLDNHTVTFTGAHKASDLQHWLSVGTSPNSNNLFDQDLGTGHTATVAGLPNFGSIYVTYFTRNSSGWQAAAGSQYYSTYIVPSLTAPAPGTLTTTTVTFTGEHDSADLQHWLFVGTAQGSSNLFNQDLGTGHTAMVSGLPTGPIWARYFTRLVSGWYFIDHSYTR